MLDFKKQLSVLASEAAEEKFPGCALDSETVFEMLEYPPDTTMGDVALPCFKLSRTLRKAPPMIASELCEAISGKGEGVVSSVTADGGYLNFKISPDYLIKNVLLAIEEKGDMYGSTGSGVGKTVVLDYSSPNISKPFHIGHLGTTVIGHSLKLLHQ